MKIAVAVACAVAVATVLAGCAGVVDGSGSSRLSGSALPSDALPGGGSTASEVPQSGGVPTTAPSPSAPASTEAVSSTGPSSSTGSAAAATSCPRVAYPAAHLTFDCVTTGMVAHVGGTGEVWPLSEEKTLEPKTGWVVDEGAGHWGAPQGHSLAAIALNVRQQMIHDQNYGTTPKVATVASHDTTVGGATAHVLQTTFTLSRAFIARSGTKVRHEKLWIVALQVGSNDVSLWYASEPDLVRGLWPKVPSIIASIRVS